MDVDKRHSEQVRRSQRETKGRKVKPTCCSRSDNISNVVAGSVAEETESISSSTLSRFSSVSRRSSSSAAEARKRKAELVAAQRVAALEEEARSRRLESEKRLSNLQLAADLAAIQADEEVDNGGTAAPVLDYGHSERAMDMQESHYFVRDGEEPVSAQDAEQHPQHEEVEVTQSVMPAQGYTDSDPHDAATPAVIPATSLVQPLCAAEIRIQELEGQLKLCRQNTGSIERAYDDKLTVELEEKRRLKDELQLQQQTIATLKQRIFQEDARHADQVQVIKSLEGDLAKAEASNDRLQSDLVARDHRISQLTSTSCDLEDQVQNLEYELEETRAQLAVMQVDMAPSNRERCELQTKAQSEPRGAAGADTPTCDLPSSKSAGAGCRDDGPPKRPASTDGPASLQTQATSGDSIQTAVASAVSQLAQVLSDKLTPPRATTPAHQNTSDKDLRRMMARQSATKDLPAFNGDPTAWPMFNRTFTASTAECGFSNQENMTRLQRALKGKALDSVKSMLVVPDNIDRVMHTLQMRFGQPDHVVQSMIAQVKTMPKLRDDDFEQLIDLANSVSNLVSTMELLKSTGHLANPQLRQEIVQKLPSSLTRQWGEHVAECKDPVTMKTLAEWLAKRADALCCVRRIDTTAAKCVSTGSNMKPPPTARQSGQRQTAFVASERKCDFCGRAGHKVAECREFARKTSNERWRWVKTERRCFTCLGQGHRTRECPDSTPCKKDGCDRLHHPMLHPPKRKDDVERTNLASAQQQSRVVLRTVPVAIRGPKGVVNTAALLDEASTVTLLDSDIAKQVGAEGPCRPLTLAWTNDMCQQDLDSREVTITVSGQDGDLQLSARTVRELHLPAQHVDINHQRQRWQHVSSADIPLSATKKPRLLIGQDNCHVILPRETIEGPPNAPTLSRCKLGWSIHGQLGGADQVLHARLDTAEGGSAEDTDIGLHQQVKHYFTTEFFGVQVRSEKIRSRQEAKAEKILESTTRRIGERWETGLLWRDADVSLPESKTSATRRLLSIERKMDRNPAFSEAYCAKIAQYIDDGYATKLTPSQLQMPSQRVWYLPHFGVTNPNKPGKLRLVFDAAAPSHGVSLNDALLPGPDYLNPLTSVLFKFRQHRVGFGGDIRQMFHQVHIRPDDQPAQRFLWRGSDRDREPDVYKMRAMTFGAVCSPASAQYVMRRNADEFRHSAPDAVTAIHDKHYMDDYFDSTPTAEEAAQRIKEVSQIQEAGGFSIRGWVSNSPDALAAVPPDICSPSVVTISSDNETVVEKTLGLKWLPREDAFGFSLSRRLEQSSTTEVTKREVLRKLMSVFDPLGFFTYYTTSARILLQDIWRTGVGWDEPLPGPLVQRWTDWWTGVHNLGSRSIPRCYCTAIADRKDLELHVFGDASESAFAAAAYFRLSLPDDSTRVAFVFGKSRVAPLKPVSIPRLELQAALMASRMADTVRKEHDLPTDRIVLWSDSMTVLRWIRADARRFKPFVAHRIGEIEELTDVSQWRWVPTHSSPADAATRAPPETSAAQHIWTHGPEFLTKPESEWPVENPGRDTTTSDDQAEMKAEFTAVVTKEAQLALPDISRFSSWIRLMRTTAWIVRYVNNLRAKASSKPTVTCSELLPSEYQQAQKLWWKKAQQDSFREEIGDLQKHSNVSSSSKLRDLSPVLDSDGVVRMHGRIRSAPPGSPLTPEPVILDPSHPFTQMLLQQYHVWHGHHGQDSVANDVRQTYWVLKLRTAVRRTWTVCQQCKNERAQPTPPQMGQIPDARVATFIRPFTHCGMDYFGPLTVTIGRRHEKRYGVIFTCLTTRAVHLELSHDLTTDCTIMAIRRLISRRGCPGVIYSDNGTNLRGAARELKESLDQLDQTRLTAELIPRGIKWEFNPPAAPHMGGAWERLVRSVKTALRAVLKERAPREDTRITLLTEVEAILNSRPLTHVSSDPTDDNSLTLNHFLLGTPAAAPVPGVFSGDDLHLRRQWRIVQVLADHFWRRWIKEYLPTLARQTKWHGRTEKKVEVGDVVVIADDNAVRNTWPKGIVTATYPRQRRPGAGSRCQGPDWCVPPAGSQALRARRPLC
ncbi:uncharacterized protein LOC135811008 [Sycon ciliatum]|uniref:uncharacterized protein LOC135811008 n=1 Tax=Sycon ciliatum TaxID=27933 RepID=UPI0031F65543